MKPNQSLMQKLVHPKDIIQDMDRSNIVYCVLCANCHAAYVEETERSLSKRMDEHWRAVERAKVEVSALAEYV